MKRDKQTKAIIKRQEKVTTDWWGPRCPDYHPACACCKAWARTDILVQLIDDTYHADTVE